MQPLSELREGSSSLQGMTPWGQGYLFSLGKEGLQLRDRSCTYGHLYETPREYTALCAGGKGVLYAAVRGEGSTLYRLGESLASEEKLPLDTLSGAITALGWDSVGALLLCAVPGAVYCYNPRQERLRPVYRCPFGFVGGVCALGERLLLGIRDQGGQRLCLVEEGRTVAVCPVPGELLIKTLFCEEGQVRLLLERQGGGWYLGKLPHAIEAGFGIENAL